MLRCAKAGVHAHCVYLVDQKASRIYMEKIEGVTLKEFLKQHYDVGNASYDGVARELVMELGKAVARIHDAEMVHGDLTTSNVLVVEEEEKEEEGGAMKEKGERKEGGGGGEGCSRKNQQRRHHLVTIDFGLGYLQPLPEDKAVDLYVLERAFVSTHPHSQTLVDLVLEAYQHNSSPHHSPGVLKKLEDVRRRGRKRDMFG